MISVVDSELYLYMSGKNFFYVLSLDLPNDVNSGSGKAILVYQKGRISEVPEATRWFLFILITFMRQVFFANVLRFIQEN